MMGVRYILLKGKGPRDVVTYRLDGISQTGSRTRGERAEPRQIRDVVCHCIPLVRLAPNPSPGLRTISRRVRGRWELGRAVVHGAVGGKHGLGRRDICQVPGARILGRGVDDLADNQRVLVLVAGATRQSRRVRLAEFIRLVAVSRLEHRVRSLGGGNVTIVLLLLVIQCLC